ncbi:MAG TPA: hypothetical protein VK943_09740 [Arenibaculum sp.]|nr:hypothetical protein [Arenibaculum sp.]
MKETISPAPMSVPVDVSVAVLADDDTVLLYGTATTPVPAAAAIRLDADAAAGEFRALSWPAQDDGPHRFVAALRVPGLARLRPGRMEAACDDGRRIVIPRLANVRINPWLLISALREERPEALPPVLDFLSTVLTGTGEGERSGRLLGALIQGLAQPDGFAEIFGRFRGTGLMIQGWSRALRPDLDEVLIETEDCRTYRTAAGTFGRSDLPPSARGFLAVLPDADLDPASIRRLYHRGDGGWCRIDVFENRTVLAEGDAAGHLRDMLGGLGGAETALRQLKRISSSQYDGHDTVSRLEVPVRAALDTALRAPGIGLFVGGWLLDPDMRVAGVTLHGPGFAARLDPDWARSPRPDVSQAFGADPLFTGRILPGDDIHGFRAFVPEPAGLPANADFHLELLIEDESRAFLPVQPNPPSPEAVRRLLGTIDLDDPAAETLVARHIGPIVQAAGRIHSSAAAAGSPPHRMGVPLAAPRLSVVLPVADGREDIDLSLVRLAADPDFADAEILVVAGTGTGRGFAAAVRRAADFYRLCVCLVSAPRCGDTIEATAAALPHARAEQILLLSPDVLPTRLGWLAELQRAARQFGSPAMVSPTLLYEDQSIRFAGIVEDPDAANGLDLTAQYVGYPEDWPPERHPTPVDAATTDCALIPKHLLTEAGDFGAGYVADEYKGLDLCLRLRAAGHACLWVPAVRLVALDDPHQHGNEYWQRTAALVDRWRFGLAWAGRTATTTPTAAAPTAA